MTLALLGLLVLSAPLPPATRGGVVKDLTPSARLALHGYMVNCPEPIEGKPGLLRASFGCNALPWPVVGHAQWDWGDCTGRAVQAWLFARRMTGEADFGRDVERPQRATLLSLLTPTRGMPCVPDLSDPDHGVYHYQMWDQGRTLRGLVRWWLNEPDARVRADLQVRLRKMISSLDALATHGHDATYGDYAVYPWDNVVETTLAGAPTKTVPGQDLWIMRGGQLLEPLAMYWAASADPDALRFARQICAGVISGHEADTYQGPTVATFRFGADGSFGGHFHDHASIALGVAKLGTALVRRGDREEGLRLLRWAKTVYDWTVSQANVNAGSTWGWFPENVGSDNTQAREVCEICCTADMIELAAALAGAANLHPSLSSWDALWDHVERYTVNTILPAQFRVTGRYLSLLGRGSTLVRNGYVSFELDQSGCYNHEVVGHQTLASADGGHASQILYGVAYDDRKAYFAWPGGRPMESHALVTEAPTSAAGGRLTGAVHTADGVLRIVHETSCGQGPYVTTRFTVTNTGAARIADARLAYLVNLDYADYARNEGHADSARGRLTVRSTMSPGALGMAGDPAPAYVTVNDAVYLMQSMSAFDWSAPASAHTGNPAGELGWDLGSLAPGESKTVTVTLAAVGDAEAIDRALSHEAFPKRDVPALSPEMAAAHRLEGAWIAAYQPNDLALRGDDGQAYANMMGCCHPAGVRGLFACWQSAFGDDGTTLRSRLPICREGADDVASQWVTEDSRRVEQRIKLRAARRLMVRLPDWASVGEVNATANGGTTTFRADGRWLDFGRLKAGATVTLTYPMVSRTTKERVGGNGKTGGFCPAAEKREFTVLWRGNVVVGLDPAGPLLPLWPSVEAARRELR